MNDVLGTLLAKFNDQSKEVITALEGTKSKKIFSGNTKRLIKAD